MEAEYILQALERKKSTTKKQLKTMLYGWGIIIAVFLLSMLLNITPKSIKIIHTINSFLVFLDAIALAVFVVLSIKWIMFLDLSIDRSDSYIAIFEDYVEIKQTIGRFKTIKQTVEIPYINMEEWKLCDSVYENSTRVNCIKIKLNQPMETINAKEEIVTTNEFVVLMAGYDKVEFMKVMQECLDYARSYSDIISTTTNKLYSFL